MNYEEMMRLWQQYEVSCEEHNCPTEEFTSCEICEAGIEAKLRVGNHLDDVMELLEHYHDALGDLTHNVIQEVEPPRPECLQHALRHALRIAALR